MKSDRRLRRMASTPLPPEQIGTPWLRRCVAFLLPLVLLGLISATTTILSSSPDNILTVCPLGPPQCEYAAIQPALDAAAPGDTVLVAPGTYTGQLTLRSQVTLASTGGPAVTIITASQGPIVKGNSAVSVTLRGLTISGQAVETRPIGIDLLDTDFNLYDSTISGLRGKDGAEGAPDGEFAIAIQAAGTGRLTVTGSALQDVHGGSGLPGVTGGSAGGDAIGIAMTGRLQASITRTHIRRLSGGGAGGTAWWPYGCDGRGGRAIATQASGDVQLAVDNCQIIDLAGGAPCRGGAEHCAFNAGATVGIQAVGGILTVHDSLLSGFFASTGGGSEINYGIHTAFTAATLLERNTIALDSATSIHATSEIPAAGPDSPFCVPPPRSVIAIASEGAASLVARDNSLNNVGGTGLGGVGEGIWVKGVAVVELVRNKVLEVSGGYGGLTASGFRLEQVGSARIDANAVGGIHGQAAPDQFYYLYRGSDGGSAAGIELTDVADATVVNNAIWALDGGAGTNMLYESWLGRDGGDATALIVTGSWARIWNNSCNLTVGGRGGDGDKRGRDGSAVGLRLSGSGEVSVSNNALVQHGVGISSTLSAAPDLQHNDLWANGTDYAGVAPGASDLRVAPAFADPQRGDLHLTAGSALIDAGANAAMPPADLDGDPRPQDGNHDGNAIADIGADEYWPGLRGVKVVDRSVATSGDVLTYWLTLTMSTDPYLLPGVRITDTIPVHTTFVRDSLSASSGTWNDANGMVTWTGDVSVAEPVTLTFKVKVDDVTGPLAIVNRAVLDDSLGPTRTLQAVTLIDPLRWYLPVFFGLSD